MIVAVEAQVMRIADLDVTVKISDRRRTVGLTVERDATITAIVPPETNEDWLARAITAKRPWLFAKLRQHGENGLPRPPREYVRHPGPAGRPAQRAGHDAHRAV